MKRLFPIIRYQVFYKAPTSLSHGLWRWWIRDIREAYLTKWKTKLSQIYGDVFHFKSQESDGSRLWGKAGGRRGAGALRGGLHTRCPSTVPEYGTRWALLWTHLFLSTHANFRVLNWPLSRCVHTIYFSSGAIHCFVLRVKPTFQDDVWQCEIELHIGFWRCEHNTILCPLYPATKCEKPLTKKNYIGG